MESKNPTSRPRGRPPKIAVAPVPTPPAPRVVLRYVDGAQLSDVLLRAELLAGDLMTEHNGTALIVHTPIPASHSGWWTVMVEVRAG